ncbi:hypothetical protein G6F31_016078 [Rhizopus arrhizus]|nr:hypothetical protein G6F31_016078 [Rhizopus arrhizus]
MRLAASDDLGAVRGCVGDVFLHLFHGAGVDQRTLRHAVGEAVAHLHGVDLGDQALGDLFIDAGLHVDAVGAHAGLAGVAVLRGQDAVHGAVQVGIGQHDQRILAAQLHLRAGGQARSAVDLFACRGRPGKGDRAHRARGGDGGPNGGGGTHHQIQHPRRQPRLHERLGQPVARQWRVGRRLEHHGVASDQRWRDLARRDRNGEVPRRDHRDHPQRVALALWPSTA